MAFRWGGGWEGRTDCLKIIVDHLSRNIPKKVVNIFLDIHKGASIYTAVATTMSMPEQNRARSKENE